MMSMSLSIRVDLRLEQWGGIFLFNAIVNFFWASWLLNLYTSHVFGLWPSLLPLNSYCSLNKRSLEKVVN